MQSLSRRAPYERRGFALIAALWLVVALGAIGAAISAHARTRRLVVANALEEDRGLAAAEAGLAHLQSRLARLTASDSLPIRTVVDFAADPWREAPRLSIDATALGQERYRVVVEDAGGSLNINRATEEELKRFLIALPLDAGEATEIAESIMDWRDSDDLHRLHGAEAPDYLAHGSPVLPRNADFARVEELQYVKGVTPELLARARPFLTVFGSGEINLNAAPRPVLLALPGMTDEAVAVLLRQRGTAKAIHSLEELSANVSSGPRASLQKAMRVLMPLDMMPLIGFETRELHVQSEGWVDGSPIHKRVDALIVRKGIGGTVSLVRRS